MDSNALKEKDIINDGATKTQHPKTFPLQLRESVEICTQ